MNKLYSIMGVSMLTLGLTTPSFADNPCMPIAQACMQEGYYKGGHDSGKGLIEDCVMPVVKKEKTVGTNQFSDEVLKQCENTIQQKMKEQPVTNAQ